MSQIVELFIPIDAAGEPLESQLAHQLGCSTASLGSVRVLRRALDARKGRPLGYQMRVEVARPGEALAGPPPLVRPAWPAGRSKPRVVIIGSGPAGTWAALRLAEMGLSATIVERGKPVQPRRHDLASLQRGLLNPDSNYCFGEGGAGTYSDGKLYTRSKDRPGIAAILSDLVRFGAPPAIAIESRPHVGSNLLPKVLTNLRLHLEAAGVSYRFDSEAVGLRTETGEVRGVRLRGGDEVPADAVVMAVGHSARSVYEWFFAAGMPVERKDLAVGVRIEHPQPVIDRMQYGKAAGDPRLPPAFYELKTQAADRGVYSFCMCPGGWIVPAATEPGGVVINGMSLSRRDSAFANSGMVVTVRGADFGPAAAGPLAGIAFQRRIEAAAFVAGGERYQAPAQRLDDFIAGRCSGSLPPTSYHPGVISADLMTQFPEPVAVALREGLRALLGRYRGLVHPDALLVSAETRTSAPLRMVRDPVTLQSPGCRGLYPTGEGAGYAGGIVSAALDGARVAEAIRAQAS